MRKLSLLPKKDTASILQAMAKDVNALIGQNIRRIRLARGLSQLQLAKAIGTVPQRISACESGRTGAGKSILENISRRLGVSWWEFYIDEDTPLVSGPGEMKKLMLHRQEMTLGIADEVMDLEQIWIARVKYKAAHAKTDKERISEMQKIVTKTALREKIQQLKGKMEKKKKTA